MRNYVSLIVRAGAQFAKKKQNSTITQNKAVWEKTRGPEGEDKRREATEAEKDKEEGGEWARRLAYFSRRSNVWNVFGGRSRWERLGSGGGGGEGGVNSQLSLIAVDRC